MSEPTRHPCGHLIVSDECIVCAPTPAPDAADDLVARLLPPNGCHMCCEVRAEAAAAIEALQVENAALQAGRDALKRELEITCAHLGLDHLLAERDALRPDAERWRWLRKVMGQAVGGGIEVNDARLVYEDPIPGENVRVFWYPDTPVGFFEYEGATLDEAVDAARRDAT